ncbi:MAG: response regulator [bacterium]|nr:response regulator [bacterium]
MPIIKKILLVDNDKDCGILLKELLINENFKFLIASTLTEGMLLLEKENPEFVFLDNILPDGLGWEKTEYILHNYPKTQLNLLGGFNVPKTSALTFRILEKPLTSDEFLLCLNNYKLKIV